ncbi:MAG: transposase [Bacillota bacterium]|nr:transposase [Bacillota bacterium]
MPRTARIKSEAGIYHIMVRSISDIPLFRSDEDKDRYLSLVKKYQIIFRFKVYAYCLMTTHAHMIVDCCGADISKIMKSINQCYSAYFNKKYKRHGHVFQDRFKSKLVSDEKYLLVLSAYVHSNPKDIEEYRGCVELFEYSSLGLYLGIAVDRFGIMDSRFILGHFSSNTARAQKTYLEFINRISDSDDKIDIEFEDEGSECRSERRILLRNFPPEEIVAFVSKYTGTPFNIHIKFNHRHTELKCLTVLIMRSLCNFGFRDLCTYIGNITQSNLWHLCDKGYDLLTKEQKYSLLVENLITKFSA